MFKAVRSIKLARTSRDHVHHSSRVTPIVFCFSSRYVIFCWEAITEQSIFCPFMPALNFQLLHPSYNGILIRKVHKAIISKHRLSMLIHCLCRVHLGPSPHPRPLPYFGPICGLSTSPPPHHSVLANAAWSAC